MNNLVNWNNLFTFAYVNQQQIRIMNTKYKIRTDISKTFRGKTIYRIEALKDFGDVKKGDLGGWVEKENNLSQEGNCWVYDNACVYDNAIVTNNATVRDEASVYGDTCVWKCLRLW